MIFVIAYLTKPGKRRAAGQCHLYGERLCWNYFCAWLFLMLMVTGVSLLGILAALVVATAVMFLGGMFALMIKLLPWLLLAVAVVWVIKAVKTPKIPQYQRNNRRFY